VTTPKSPRGWSHHTRSHMWLADHPNPLLRGWGFVFSPFFLKKKIERK
jgi:hypothetical protein